MSEFNPYQSPQSDMTPHDDDWEIPELWNPNAAASWSILMTPLGAWLHAKNWQELGDDDLAKQNFIAFWAILGMIIGSGFFSMLTGIDIPAAATSLTPLLIWYFALGKKQVNYVKEYYGDEYYRKSWLIPILGGIIGGGAIVVLFFMLLAIIFESLGLLHPNFQ